MAQEDKLFIDKLEGVKNWQVWKYQMQVILEARELYSGVTLMERQPARLYQKAIHQVHRLKQLSKKLRGRPKLYLLRVQIRILSISLLNDKRQRKFGTN